MEIEAPFNKKVDILKRRTTNLITELEILATKSLKRIWIDK